MDLLESIHILSILACLLGAVLAPILHSFLKEKSAYILSLIPAGIFIAYLKYLPMGPQALYLESFAWFPEFGVNLSFLLDGLSLLFVLLISGIGALVFVYAGGYFKGDVRAGRALGFLMLFTASMLGLVLSENLFSLFVFWELTSISSYFLIAHKAEKEESKTAALTALLVTGLGALFLLAGFILLFLIGRSFGLETHQAAEISWLFRFPIQDHPLFVVCFLLILVGCLTKSAQVPFHFWLPAAMAAPTPVSSFLHSATMVKAGVYLLARLSPGFGGNDLWFWSLCSFGALTFVWGAVAAGGFRDLKRILAYTTLSILGALVMLIGVGTEKSIMAAIVLLIAHALYKAPLFQIAGAIDLALGTRDIRKLGGLSKKVPWLAVAALLALASQAGLPLFFGFFAKELGYEALIRGELYPLLVVAFLANTFLVAMALLVGWKPFFSDSPEPPEAKLKNLSWTLVLGPLLMGTLSVVLALFPNLIFPWIGPAATSSVLGYVNLSSLSYWHGWGMVSLLVLALSGFTLLMGFLLYKKRETWILSLEKILKRLEVSAPERIYQGSYEQMFVSTERLTRFIQHGYLNRYMTLIVVLFVLASGFVLIPRGLPVIPVGDLDWGVFALSLSVLPIIGGALVLRSKSHLASVASLGIVGVGVALMYAVFSAPDLSLTQIMVEILTVILLVFVFYHLPRAKEGSSRKIRVLQFGTALGAALSVVWLLVLAIEPSSSTELAEFYRLSSVPEAFGRNIVNVILVDFRAIDTLGEIVVVAVAGIGVYALLKNSRFGRKTRGGAGE